MCVLVKNGPLVKAILSILFQIKITHDRKVIKSAQLFNQRKYRSNAKAQLVYVKHFFSKNVYNNKYNDNNVYTLYFLLHTRRRRKQLG